MNKYHTYYLLGPHWCSTKTDWISQYLYESTMHSSITRPLEPRFTRPPLLTLLALLTHPSQIESWPNQLHIILTTTPNYARMFQNWKPSRNGHCILLSGYNKYYKVHSFIAQCMYRWVTGRPVENEVRRVLPSLSSKQIALPLSPKIQSGTYVRTRTRGAIHLIPFRTVRVPSAKSRMFVQVRDAGLHTRSSSLSRLVQVCCGAENGLSMPDDGIWCVSILLLFVPFFLSSFLSFFKFSGDGLIHQLKNSQHAWWYRRRSHVCGVFSVARCHS